jgi:hypothetical protein
MIVVRMTIVIKYIVIHGSMIDTIDRTSDKYNVIFRTPYQSHSHV